MEFRDNDYDSKEILMTTDKIKIPHYYKNEKYLISIYISKDNININFKLEKEKIQTYYFFEKFDLRDLNQKSKLFLTYTNIKEIFVKLKEISNSYFIDLEIKGNKISIIFKNISTNAVIKFALRKKIVSQKKINNLIEEQLGDNTSKLNIIKNQIIKTDKSINIKNDIINNIRTRITKINDTLNNIPIISTNNNSIINSSTKNSSTNESNSENNSNHNNEDEYQETMNDSNNINQTNQNQNQKPETNNNVNNNKNINNNTKKNDNNNKNNDNNLDTFFCFDKNDPAQNKKIIELLIILNVVTIVIVLYILSSVYNFRLNLDPDAMNENEDDYDDSKLTYLTFLRRPRNDEQNFRDIFQEDLDLLNKGDDGITSSSHKEEYLDKKGKKNNERYFYYSNDLY
jgi:hypothetical protein